MSDTILIVDDTPANLSVLAECLSAAGYAEFHPVSDNNSPAGRAQNRRLDIVILAPYQPLRQNPDNSMQDATQGPSPPATPAVR